MALLYVKRLLCTVESFSDPVSVLLSSEFLLPSVAIEEANSLLASHTQNNQFIFFP